MLVKSRDLLGYRRLADIFLGEPFRVKFWHHSGKRTVTQVLRVMGLPMPPFPALSRGSWVSRPRGGSLQLGAAEGCPNMCRVLR